MKQVKIFVSYAHEDQSWVEEGTAQGLMPWLRNQLKRDDVDFWWDHGIHAGDAWEQMIFEKIDEAQIVILLLSDDFAGSDYIMDHELPRIRERYLQGQLMVLLILISTISRRARDRLTWVVGIQMLPNDKKGLNTLLGGPAWTEIRSEILDEIYHRVCLLRTEDGAQVDRVAESYRKSDTPSARAVIAKPRSQDGTAPVRKKGVWIAIAMLGAGLGIWGIAFSGKGSPEVLPETPVSATPAAVAKVPPATAPPIAPPKEPAPTPAPARAIPKPGVAPVDTGAVEAAASVQAMKESIKAGQIREFTFDEVQEWKVGPNETIDGETYQTGTASYEAETIFGNKAIKAKALIQGGKVRRWIWPSSGMEIK